jgi:hypothetical protein
MDYAIAFGPQSDIVQALIAGGAESLTDEYLKKFNVGEAFERPNQKGWGGARNRGRERGRSLGKEECRSRRERLTEDLRLAEETRLNPRRPVHLNEERHDHTVKERLLSKDGYPVFVYKYRKGILGSALMKSARTLRLSRDCHTLVLQQLQPPKGKDPTEFKVNLSYITKIYHGIQTKVLHRVFPGVHKRDDEELRCGTIVHDGGPGTDARDTNIEFIKPKAPLFNYMDEAVKNDHSEATSYPTRGANVHGGILNCGGSNRLRERAGMAVEVGRGTEENKEGSNAGRPSAGDPETDAFIYTSGQTEQLGNALDESKEGSPGSRTETSREDVASGIGYFNKMNNKTSEMQSEWEGDPEGCAACLKYLIEQVSNPALSHSLFV